MLGQNDGTSEAFTITILPDNADAFTPILAVLTMLMALFLGCTFNTMNIVAEKEEGIGFINEILPMSKNQYIMQKTAIGFIGGFVVSCLTALILMDFGDHTLSILLLIMLSSLMASLTGLYLGMFSDPLITSIMNIKVVLVVFMAVPLIAYLFVPPGIAKTLFNLLPSFPAFEGLVRVMQGESVNKILKSVVTLAVHCAGWYLLYICLSNKGKACKRQR